MTRHEFLAFPFVPDVREDAETLSSKLFMHVVDSY